MYIHSSKVRAGQLSVTPARGMLDKIAAVQPELCVIIRRVAITKCYERIASSAILTVPHSLNMKIGM